MIYIYKAKSPSGKYYIGLTNNFEKRKRDHLADAFNSNISHYNSAFKNAIRKYGRDSILWEVIDAGIDYDVASELERRYILHFDSYNNGYNMTLGGEEGYKYSQDDIFNIAKEFKTRLEWHSQNGGSYISAKSYGDNFFEKCPTTAITCS